MLPLIALGLGVTGAAAAVAGVGLLFGPGWALLAFAGFALAAAYLLARGA